MVVVVQVEVGFAAEDARDLVVVALVAEHVLADGAGRAEAGGIAHVVVGRADEVAGVAFFDQLGDRARRRRAGCRRSGPAARAGLSLVGLARVGALQHNAGWGCSCVI